MAIKVVYTSDMQKVLNEQAKLEAKLLGMEGTLRKVGDEGKRTKKKLSGAFGTKRLVQFAGALLGVGGVAAGLRKVIGLYDEMKRKANEAADASLGIEANLKRLVQLSGGSATRFAELKGVAESLTRKHGIEFNRALGLTFEASSIGFTDKQIGTFGEFRKFTTEVPSLVSAVGGVRGAFGPEVGGGSIRSVINSLFAASVQSKVPIEGIAGQVLTPSQIVKKQGGTFEETTAALGVMAVAVKSVEEAAVQISALAKVLEKGEETKGLGLLGGVKRLLELPLERQEEIAGRELRASKGFGLFVQNLPQIEKAIDSIVQAQKLTGTPQSLISLATSISSSDPELLAQEAFRRARGSRMITERETLGVPRLQIQAVQELVRETLVRQGRGAIAQGLSEKFLEKVSSFTDDPETILGIGAKIVGRGITIPGAPQEFLPPSQNRARALAQEAAFKERGEAEADFREAARLLLGSAQAQDRSAKALERGTTGGAAMGSPTEDR